MSTPGSPERSNRPTITQAREACFVSHSKSDTPQHRKHCFDGVYDRDDPVHYFTTLKPYDYRTPGHAQPIFRRCISQLQRLRNVARPTVLDLCCGYGVNAALINHDLTMDDLYRHYARATRQAPANRVASDRRFFKIHRRAGRTVRVIGLDVAPRALSYATEVGLLDESMTVNLESETLSFEQRATVARADLITVTGGLSYIGVRTFLRLLSAFPQDRRPWIAFLPLRHMDVRGLEALFRKHGMVTEAWEDRAFKHRKFTDAGERNALLEQIDDRVDPVEAPPSETCLEAVFYLARPRGDAARVPLAGLFEGRGSGARPAAEAAWSSRQ